jgi:hypothetical protein
MFPSVTYGGWVFVPIIGLSLIVWGFLCLMYLIPRGKGDSNVRTDVFSVRASYMTIVVGLACTTVWVLSAVVVRCLAILKFAHIMH